MRVTRFRFPDAVGAVLAGAIACTAVPGAAMAAPALVLDTGTGAVLHAHAAAMKWYPASLTKMMAAYVTFQAIEAGRIGLKSPVGIRTEDVTPPRGVVFPVGTTFTVEEALPLVLAASNKAATTALGAAVSGSVAAFVAEMNAAAARLGMVDTHYVNPHGFFAKGHWTTARDQAILTRAIVRDFPQYQHFFAVPSVTVDGKVLTNHNSLIGHYPGADGMKSGYVCESGFNLVGTATRDDRRLVVVVLGAFSEAERAAVAERLLDAGFAMEAAGQGGAGVRLDSLPSSGEGAIDMRRYVCGSDKAPAALRSFGTMAPLPRPKPF